jgi:hypothetical protein
MKKLFLILILASPAFAQLDYSPKATNKEAAVKMHFAITLFRGADPAQEQFLLRAINDRRSVNEIQAQELFTRDDLRDTFFAIGRASVTDFRRIYERGRIAEKKLIWETLTRAEQDDVRRINMAWGVGYIGFNQEQMNFALRFSKALPTIRLDDPWEEEALRVFPKDVANLIFGSIGPYTDKPCEVSFIKVRALFGNCPCNRGSSFNMSCDDECSNPNGCTTTDDGCGFAWMYACNGGCTVSENN